MVARVTRLVAEKFVLSTFHRALTTLSSMCSRVVRALESSPGLIMMMDSTRKEYLSDRDAGFKQPLERCKLLTRWAFEYFDQTGCLADLFLGRPRSRRYRCLRN